MDPVLIILLVAIGGSIVIYIVVSVLKQQHHKLLGFAEGMGLEVVKGRFWEQPTLHGTYGDRSIQIKNIYHSTGKSGYYTYKIFYESLAFCHETVEVRIGRYGSISRFFINIAKAFGYKVVSFDDSEFNSSAIVRSSNDDFALSLVDFGLQQDIQNIGKGKIIIKGYDITYEAYGQAQDNEERVHEILPFLNKVERKLERLDTDYSDTYEEDGLNPF
jgi:hypothetical protein